MTKRKAFKIFCGLLLTITVASTLSGCGGKAVPQPEGILGQWYRANNEVIWTYIFYDDNTYVYWSEDWDKSNIQYAKDQLNSYDYDQESSTLKSITQQVNYSLKLTDNSLTMTEIGYEDPLTITLWRAKVDALKNDPLYYSTDTFLRSIADSDGFCVQEGILYGYIGDAKEVTVPSNVKRIYDLAFSWDFDHGVNLEKVTIPGNVETIDGGAFSFTNADCIIIEEGVKEIGDSCFMDSYIHEIHFPASLVKIGNGIMETEEGLPGCKIYVPKGSKIAKYFENDMPYGDAELIYE